MCKQGLFYVCKEVLVGKLQFPRFESQLPNSVAVTRYVFNKPNPEDKLNVDFEKDNLNLAAYGTKKGCWLAADDVFSDVRNSCIFMHQK